MEKLQLGTAFILFVCAIGMFANTIYQSSPMKALFVALMGIVTIGAYFMLKMSYKEYKEAKNEQSRND